MTHYKGLPHGSSDSFQIEFSRVIRLAAFGFILLTLSTVTQAATIGLTGGDYDVETIDANVGYTFTAWCLGDDGGATSGLCGTDNGLNGPNKITYDGSLDAAASSGLFSITEAGGSFDQILSTPDGAGFLTSDSYTLTANFDGSGYFVDGTVTILGLATASLGGSLPIDWPGSGTILTADIDLFGFFGTGTNGVFEFSLTNIGGDFATYGSFGGVIVNATGLNHSGIGGSELWDDDAEFFQTSFNGTHNVDTFVPVPAAVWLFGSGLLGLISVGRFRKKAS